MVDLAALVGAAASAARSVALGEMASLRVVIRVEVVGLEAPTVRAPRPCLVSRSGLRVQDLGAAPATPAGSVAVMWRPREFALLAERALVLVPIVVLQTALGVLVAVSALGRVACDQPSVVPETAIACRRLADSLPLRPYLTHPGVVLFAGSPLALVPGEWLQVELEASHARSRPPPRQRGRAAARPSAGAMGAAKTHWAASERQSRPGSWRGRGTAHRSACGPLR